jgi:hypothetical protein
MINIKLGVCISNSDPFFKGRIRAIPLDNITNSNTLLDILSLVETNDRLALSENIYRPWISYKFENFKERDPFICDSFLPKTFSASPIEGQLVKIIVYDDPKKENEFIGPYTSNQLDLSEEYRDVVNNLESSLDYRKFLPSKNKTLISGFSREQLMLGDNEFLVRFNYSNSDNINRNNTYPFIQFSQFNESYSFSEETVTRIESSDVGIDYVCQVFLTYRSKTSATNRNFIANIILFEAKTITNDQGKLGLTKNTYNSSERYIEPNFNDYTVKHYINTSSVKELSKFISDVLGSYSNSGTIKYFDNSSVLDIQRLDSDNTEIIIYNNLTIKPNSGGANNERNVIPNLRNWLFRLDPDLNRNIPRPDEPPSFADENDIRVLRYKDFLGLDEILNKYRNELNYGSLAIDNSRTVTSREFVSKNNLKPISVHTTYSDKFLFLSSLNSPSLIDDDLEDGLSSIKISTLYNNSNKNVKTFGFLRGEKLIELIIEVIDVLMSHGHEAGIDPRASLIVSSQERFEAIKKRLREEMNINQNNVIINHNLRLN